MKKLIFILNIVLAGFASAAAAQAQISSVSMLEEIEKNFRSDQERFKAQLQSYCPTPNEINILAYKDIRDLSIADIVFSRLEQKGGSDVPEQRNLYLTSTEKFELPQNFLAKLNLVFEEIDKKIRPYFNSNQTLESLIAMDPAVLFLQFEGDPRLENTEGFAELLKSSLDMVTNYLEVYSDYLQDPKPCLQFKDTAFILFYILNNNFFLHLNHPELLPKSVHPIVHSLRRQISNSLKKFPSLNLTTYVGTALPLRDLIRMRSGEALNYAGFLSGSLDTSFLQFTINTILVVQNKSGRMISSINPGESEVIFYNPRFKLKEKKIDEKGRYWLYLEEL